MYKGGLRERLLVEVIARDGNCQIILLYFQRYSVSLYDREYHMSLLEVV
jgi:hypothetical protein